MNILGNVQMWRCLLPPSNAFLVLWASLKIMSVTSLGSEIVVLVLTLCAASMAALIFVLKVVEKNRNISVFRRRVKKKHFGV